MSGFIFFLHMIIGCLIFGSIILSCWLVHYSRSPQSDTVKLKQRIFNLKFALVVDALFALLIITGFITGTLLAAIHHIPLTTPWIITAYGLLTLVSCSLFTCARIKFINLKSIRKNSQAVFRYHKTYLTLNLITVTLLIIMIHDAITKSTFF